MCFFKKYIQASTGDILIVWGQMRHDIRMQLDTLVYEVKHDQLHTLIFPQSFLYSNIKKRTSHYLIRLIQSKVNIAKIATTLPLYRIVPMDLLGSWAFLAHTVAQLLEKKQFHYPLFIRFGNRT